LLHRRPPTTSAVVAALVLHARPLSQVGLALGAQAGEQRLAEMLDEGGFSRVRLSAGTPFNVVLEVRP
jgi:hypothetical protein